MIRQKSSQQQGLGIPPALGEQERVGEMGKGNGRDKRGKRIGKRGREKGIEQQRIRDVYTMGQNLHLSLLLALSAGCLSPALGL